MYHHKFSSGKLPNGIWEHGEFGDAQGVFIHYLLVMTFLPDRKVVYYLKDEWVKVMEVFGCVKKLQ